MAPDNKAQRRRLAGTVAHRVRAEALEVVVGMLREEAGERDSHLEVELLPRVDGGRLVLVGLLERAHGGRDGGGRHSGEEGAVHDASPSARTPQHRQRNVHHLEANVFALTITIQEKHELRAAGRLLAYV